MRTVSIINLKGGVGKTVTSINMAYELMRRGRRVLLIDCDKQGNTSKFFKCYSKDRTSLSDVLTGDADIKAAVYLTDYSNTDRSAPTLDVLPADMSLINAAKQIDDNPIRPGTTRLKETLKVLETEYDYCIIDCAPDINIPIINALVASDDVVIPVVIDKFTFDGIAEVMEKIDEVRKWQNNNLNFVGCVVTSYRNTDLCNEGIEVLQEKFGKVFYTRIRWTPIMSRSTFAGVPIVEYSPRCGAAKSYKAFVEEYERGICNG